jgi:hypothetical protein
MQKPAGRAGLRRDPAQTCRVEGSDDEELGGGEAGGLVLEDGDLHHGLGAGAVLVADNNLRKGAALKAKRAAWLEHFRRSGSGSPFENAARERREPIPSQWKQL